MSLSWFLNALCNRNVAHGASDGAGMFAPPAMAPIHPVLGNCICEEKNRFMAAIGVNDFVTCTVSSMPWALFKAFVRSSVPSVFVAKNEDGMTYSPLTGSLRMKPEERPEFHRALISPASAGLRWTRMWPQTVNASMNGWRNGMNSDRFSDH